MTSKSMKSRPAPAKPMTEEERINSFLAALARKREQYASNIITRLAPRMKHATAKQVAARAVALADALCEILYPIPQEGTEE